MPDITSKHNENLRLVEKLRDRKHRDREGLFVVEGPRAYRRAHMNGWEPVLTLIDDDSPDIGAVSVGRTLSVARSALDSVSYRSKSEGLIGIFEKRHQVLGELDLPKATLILVLEGLEKPGNLGAMLRTALMAEVDAVLLVDSVVDLYNPNVIRASTGAVFEMAVVDASWAEVTQLVAERGLVLSAATPEAKTSLWEIDWAAPAAIVIGSEAEGLSTRARDSARNLFSIPGRDNTVDSLNASVATAVVLFEVMRQRNA